MWQIASDVSAKLGVSVDTVLVDTMTVMRRLHDEGLLAIDSMPAADPDHG